MKERLFLLLQRWEGRREGQDRENPDESRRKEVLESKKLLPMVSLGASLIN